MYGDLKSVGILTERHGDQAHHPSKAHLGLMLVVDAIAGSTQAILLVVVLVAGYSLIGVYLLDVMHCRLIWGRRVTRVVYGSLVSPSLLKGRELFKATDLSCRCAP